MISFRALGAWVQYPSDSVGNRDSYFDWFHPSLILGCFISFRLSRQHCNEKCKNLLSFISRIVSHLASFTCESPSILLLKIVDLQVLASMSWGLVTLITSKRQTLIRPFIGLFVLSNLPVMALVDGTKLNNWHTLKVAPLIAWFSRCPFCTIKDTFEKLNH